MKNISNPTKIVGISLGLIVAAFGIALIYKSTIGSSSMATLSDGVGKLLSIKKGTANILCNLVLMIPAYIWDKDKIGVGTVLMVLTMGIYINLWGSIISSFPTPNTLWIQILICIIGINFLSMGLAYYIRYKAGMGPLEILTEVIVIKFKQSYGKCRAVLELTLLLVGIMMGGVYGLGTILCVFLTGIIMQGYTNMYNKFFQE